ncbi:MAG: hypothetical protein LBO03_04375 [Acidaminococcales bacterium]|jgi:hypothetical protein|nr:hypothetical protein [Acidaminococcales bacterium]
MDVANGNLALALGLAGRCEVCEKEIYEGDRILRDSRFHAATSYLCMDCFNKLSKEDLADFLGGKFEEAFER